MNWSDYYLHPKVPLMFLDTETTGLEPQHEVIQIGVVAMNGEEYEWKIKPERIDLADPEALKINRYDPGKWEEEGRPSGEVCRELASMLQQTQMVCCNPTFDITYLRYSFIENGISPRHLAYPKPLCVAIFAAPIMSVAEGLGIPSLRKMCDYFGVPNDGAHDALEDARMTREIYIKAVDLYREKFGQDVA